jgi:hypothetical protein
MTHSHLRGLVSAHPKSVGGGQIALSLRLQSAHAASVEMTIPFTQHFDALLPAVAAPVRITSFYDAQVFTRRWVIRDKDPNLKVLLRKMEKANSAALIDEAIGSFKQELAVRALLPNSVRSGESA